MGLKDFIDATFKRSHRPRLTVEEYHAKLIARGLNLDGSPKLDPTPMAPPIGYVKAPSMLQMMQDMLTSHKMEQALRERGAETLEDFEDFDIPDEPEQLRSAHEAPESDPTLQDLLAAGASESAARREREASQTSNDRPAPSRPEAAQPAATPGGGSAAGTSPQGQ